MSGVFMKAMVGYLSGNSYKYVDCISRNEAFKLARECAKTTKRECVVYIDASPTTSREWIVKPSGVIVLREYKLFVYKWECELSLIVG